MSSLEDEIARMAEEAVRLVKARTGETLDFSEGSVAIVEATLDEASDYFPSLSNEDADKLVHWFGCYLLEVGQRNFGGVYLWFEQRDQPVLVVGEPEFHVAMITWDKVRGDRVEIPATTFRSSLKAFRNVSKMRKPVRAQSTCSVLAAPPRH
jgi:hypothetical protein